MAENPTVSVTTPAAKAKDEKVEIEGQGCMCNGRNCNFSPWWDSKNDKRCVCGTKSSDWIPILQCGQSAMAENPTVSVTTPAAKAKDEKVEIEGQGCMCNGR